MYLVVFMSQRSPSDPQGYDAMAAAMVALAERQPGFLRIESWRDEAGFGCTLSWWQSEAAIAAWKANAQHQAAQRLGRERWYADFELQICKVARQYTMTDRKI